MEVTNLNQDIKTQAVTKTLAGEVAQWLERPPLTQTTRVRFSARAALA